MSAPRSRAPHWAERYAGTAGVVCLLGAWELMARFVWQDASTLPAPSQALAVTFAVHSILDILGHVLISLGRILAGFGIAAVLGVGLGIVCGWSRIAAILVRPFVEVLRPIPPLAWIPIAIVWFGLDETSKVFVIFLGAFFPIFTSAWKAMTMVPPVLIRAARSMDVDGVRLLWQVAVPASLPDIATGLRIGFGLSFGILVAAELIAAERGMGYLIMESRHLGQLGVAIFGIVLIGLVNLLADRQLVVIIQRTIGRWAAV